MSFLVNEDSTGTVIHRSGCRYINSGKWDKGKNGRWHGPFDSYGEAETCAAKTGRRVKNCGHCHPERYA